MFSLPELRRNFWLDFTLQRSILTPIIFSLIVYISYLTNGKPSHTGFHLACFFIFLWGIKNASETVIEEINNNTWDFQRQSSLSSLSMTIGKLLGSTLFAWYGAGISLLYYIIFFSGNPAMLLRSILVLIGGGILGQSISLLASVQVVPQIRHEHGQKTFRYFLLGLFISAIATWVTFIEQYSGASIHWFQYDFSAREFSLISLWLFALWSLIGLQRSFSRELQYQHTPIAWLGFNLFMMAYFAGLSNIYFDFSKITNNLPSTESLTLSDLELLLKKTATYTAFFIAQLLIYIVLVTEVLDTVQYRKLILRFKAGFYLEAIQFVPLWIISFILMIGAGCLTLFQLSGLSNEVTQSFSLNILITTLMLFTIRDILLFHYFCFSTNYKRVVGAFVIYLFLLYFLAPVLLSALHFGTLNVIFLPSWGNNRWLAFGSLFLQISFLTYLCISAWMKSNNK